MALAFTSIFIWVPILIEEESFMDLKNVFAQIFSDLASHKVTVDHV